MGQYGKPPEEVTNEQRPEREGSWSLGEGSSRYREPQASVHGGHCVEGLRGGVEFLNSLLQLWL